MLRIITLSEARSWDEIVRSFADYEVYYLSGYVNAHKVHGDGEPLLLLFNYDGERAINIVQKRDISMTDAYRGKIEPEQYFDLATPYGYGGFIFEGKFPNNLNGDYTEYCLDNGIVSEFVRFNPLSCYDQNPNNMYTTRLLGRTIGMKLESEEQIWSSLDGKNRNMIRKAKNNGVSVHFGNTDEIIHEFSDIYRSTMLRVNASNYYYFEPEYFKSLLNGLKQNVMIFYAIYKETIVSMAIIIFANKNVHYHLSGSRAGYQSLGATNLLLFEVALWGLRNNYSRFHLGGGLGGNEDSLFKFKESFSRKDTLNYYVGGKIFSTDRYSYLVSMRSERELKSCDSSYFPLYRAPCNGSV